MEAIASVNEVWSTGDVLSELVSRIVAGSVSEEEEATLPSLEGSWRFSCVLSSDRSGDAVVAEDDCPEGDEEPDDCRNVRTFAHFLTFGIVVKKFIVAVPFARRIASMLEREGIFLV